MTVLANLGVLIGLILVVAELRQNQVSLQAEIELNLASAYQEALGRSSENASVAELMQTAFVTPDSLSRTQFTQLTAGRGTPSGRPPYTRRFGCGSSGPSMIACGFSTLRTSLCSSKLPG